MGKRAPLGEQDGEPAGGEAGSNRRWEGWIAAYIEASTAPPGSPCVRCPNVDRGCVRVVYLGDAGVRTGTAVVWCPQCRQGSSLARVSIPVSAEVIPLDATDAEMAAVLPADVVLLPADPSGPHGRRPSPHYGMGDQRFS